ncbi:MAG TPA: hypothetical protein VMB05_06405 [Solirubrobacteraceae bacterium]|nr:hypothetical protein [Solirubrobacteraceae bacterium]
MNDSPPTTDAPRDEAPREEDLREDLPLDDEGVWLEHAELPARPRKRILAPLPVALLLALALACGFIAGVLVQKGQGGSSSGGTGFSSPRSASALGSAGARSREGSRTGSSAAAGADSTSTSGSGSSRFEQSSTSRSDGGEADITIGQVAYVSKGALYVTTSEGNTVKVTAAAGSIVTKTVETHVKGIHPGETVIVSGAANPNGSISASSIRAGEVGGSGAALFGAGANGAPSGSVGGNVSSSSGSGAGGNGGSGGSTGGPALFGKE